MIGGSARHDINSAGAHTLSAARAGVIAGTSGISLRSDCMIWHSAQLIRQIVTAGRAVVASAAFSDIDECILRIVTVGGLPCGIPADPCAAGGGDSLWNAGEPKDRKGQVIIVVQYNGDGLPV